MFNFSRLTDIVMMDDNVQLCEKLDQKICDAYTIPLNVMCDGYNTGNLWLIGGQTNVGKTQFALGEVVNLAKKGKIVAYITTEMDDVDIIRRLMPFMDPKADNCWMDNIIRVCGATTVTNAYEWAAYITYLCYMNVDVIYLDYLIPNLISTQLPKNAIATRLIAPEDNCPDDQKIVCLMECFRKIIRGDDTYRCTIESMEAKAAKQMAENTRKYPAMVILTQLNRNAGNSVPDATVLQGSFSAANKADLAANIVWATEEERQNYARGATRIMYVYKNRNANCKNHYLSALVYDPLNVQLREVAHDDMPNWKKNGRKYSS